ncbi:4Fe-4S dicluster domain-containing protein [Jiulongibacter sediminis]|uniref:4Fe-4S dicluster domain-containing protein n=1 Tax=Jiulongibacter sediminis TaxID=1605367 RepID=UPI0026EAB4AD|nr:4Fe-4S dicluster domain-containing protein [Jiulongibacter sediminis]
MKSFIFEYLCGMSYFGDIKRGIKTTAKGMSLTLKHLVDARFSRADREIQDDNFFELDKGHVTIQYPKETINVPDNGRYQLDCEIDDCIVCDKCAKICPVNCIEIEAIKSPELIRHTSDGSPVRLHAAKFDIDMAKCCFCGLCTTVCPTECLTMNSEYDYSVIDITQLNFAFANLTEAEAQEKRELYDQYMAEKEELKKAKAAEAAEAKPAAAKPVFAPKKPAFMPKKKTEESASTDKPKPVFKPAIKPTDEGENVQAARPKPVFKPKTKPASAEGETSESSPKPAFRTGMKPTTGADRPKPVFKPKLKPEAKESAEAKPAFSPKLKPKTEEDQPKASFSPKLKPKTEEEKPKASFSPKLKPKAENEDRPKPAFKPKLKPKKD